MKKSKQKTRKEYSLVGFYIGFIVSIAVITCEVVFHDISVKQAFSTVPHYILPMIVGLIGLIVGSIYGKKQLQLKKTSDFNKFLHRRYKKMTSNISEVIAIYNEKGEITYESENIEYNFGWKPEEHVRQKAWDNVHPEDIDLVKNHIFYLIKNDDDPIEVEYRMQCKDETYKWVLLSGINMFYDNDIKGVLVYFRDISYRKQVEYKLKESEFKYHHLSENMHDVVCTIDTVENPIDVNDAA